METLIKKYQLKILLVVSLSLNVFTPLVSAQENFDEEFHHEMEETVSPLPTEIETVIEEPELVEDESDFNNHIEAEEEAEEEVVEEELEENKSDLEENLLEDESPANEPEEEIEETEVELEEREIIQLTLTSEFFIYTDTDNHLNADTQKLRILPDIQKLNQAVKQAYPDLKLGLTDFANTEVELDLLSTGERLITSYQNFRGFSFKNMEDKVEENHLIKITLPSLNISKENKDYMISFIGQDLKVQAGEKASESEEGLHPKEDEGIKEDIESEEEKTESPNRIKSDASATESELNVQDALEGAKKLKDLLEGDQLSEDENLALTDETDLENIPLLDQTVEELMNKVNRTYNITIDIRPFLKVTTDNGNNFNNGTKRVGAIINTPEAAAQHINDEIKSVTGQDLEIKQDIFKQSVMTFTLEDKNPVYKKDAAFVAAPPGYHFSGLHQKIDNGSIISLAIQPILVTKDGITNVINFHPIYPNVKPVRTLKIEKYPLIIEFEPIMPSFDTEVKANLKHNSNNQIVISDNDPSGQWTLKGEITTSLIHETKPHYLKAKLINRSEEIVIQPGNSWEVGSKSKDTFNTESKYQFELTDYQLQVDNLHEAKQGTYNFQIKWTLTAALS